MIKMQFDGTIRAVVRSTAAQPAAGSIPAWNKDIHDDIYYLQIIVPHLR